MKFASSLAAIVLALIPALGNTAMAQTNAPTETEIRESYHEQGARAQLHRWYQYYENTKVGLPNQLDILAEDVTVISANGTAESREAYEAFIGQLPADWKNSHDLQDSDITVNGDGTLGLTGEIAYQNIGILPEGAVRANSISYHAALRTTDTALPLFKRIEITTGDEIDAGEFTNMYPQNRLLSLIHYWMALVEHPDRSAEPFLEILADDIDIDFGSRPITSFDGIADWVAGPASSVEASRHYVHNFSYQTLGADHYELTVDLDWNGIRPDGVQMTAKTRHIWTVRDEPTERFARIEKIRVEQLEPFAVVEN